MLCSTSVLPDSSSQRRPVLTTAKDTLVAHGTLHTVLSVPPPPALLVNIRDAQITKKKRLLKCKRRDPGLHVACWSWTRSRTVTGTRPTRARPARTNLSCICTSRGCDGHYSWGHTRSTRQSSRGAKSLRCRSTSARTDLRPTPASLYPHTRTLGHSGSQRAAPQVLARQIVFDKRTSP